MKSVNIEWVHENINKIILIDIRDKDQYDEYHIPKSINIVFEELSENPGTFLNKIESKTDYYIVCNSGINSLILTRHLNKKGYQAINVSGGVKAYAKKYKNQ